MLRSLSVVLLGTAMLASSAHAANVQQQQQQLFKQQQLIRQQQKRAEDQKRAQQNSNSDLARRTLGANRGDRAQQMASPFVRQTRINAGWDARGLGLMTRNSTVAPQHSIYDRLHAEPASITQQLSQRQAMSGLKQSLAAPNPNAKLRGGLLGSILFGPARWLQGIRNDYYTSRNPSYGHDAARRDFVKEQLEEQVAKDVDRAGKQTKVASDSSRARQAREGHERAQAIFASLKVD